MALTKSVECPLLEGGERERKEKRIWCWKKVLDVEEAKKQASFSLLMIITDISSYSITLVTVMFAGYLGELELAASTLNSWAYVTGLALMTGLSGALETLCGQGFGAKLYRIARNSKNGWPVFEAFDARLILIRVVITYLMVHCTALGFKGAALSSTISLWISFLMLAIYIKYSKRFNGTWEGLSIEAFQSEISNMKLAIPSAVMVFLKCWAFDLLVLLTGLMPNAEKSTSLIAMCTRVSNELGAGRIDIAKNAVAVTLKLSAIFPAAAALSLFFGHSIWVARGCGWQHLAAWINLAAFYIIGMPIAVLLGFKLSLHVKGLWIDLICGLLSSMHPPVDYTAHKMGKNSAICE